MQTRLSLALIVASVLAACGGEAPVQPSTDAGVADAGAHDAGPLRDGGPDVDPSEALYAPDRILEVSITLDPADWALLRVEPDMIGGPKITCASQPTERQYTYFPGDITIDGVTTTNVGVRKKGGFGSISTSKPGLKIKPNEFVSGQRIAELRNLTLNNNVQDPSLISQCLGYGLFAQAGVPASRCSFAHVTVNGEDLGLYSNVESLKKEFLARHFADPNGRLYESGGDFVPGGTGGFQPKTNETAPDCSDLSAVATAVDVPSSELASALDAVLDVDAFTTYWAMEVLTDHWDGYANNRNNYFFYHDPTSDQLHFIPWGIDALFTGRERTTRPSSVFACGRLAWRLYDEPPMRDRYLARLRELLDTVWDEAAILAEIDRMETLILPVADPSGTGDVAAAIAGVRGFVRAQRAKLLAELDVGPPVWPYASGDASCRIFIGDVSGSFDTTWGSLGQSMGTATLTGNVSSQDITSNPSFSAAGFGDNGQPVIQLFGALPDGRFAVVFVLVNNEALFAPGSAPLDLVNIAAIMTFYDPATDSTSGGGLMLDGALTITSASLVSGAPVVGSIAGRVLEF